MVKEELKKLGLHYVSLDLGEVDILESITPEQRELLKVALLKSGLVVMDDKKSMLIEKVKNVIIEMIHYTEEAPKINFSVFLAEKLNYDYTYLASLFSETEGRTIEQFVLLHKIERIKELIIYDELNLTDIAFKLHYSSVAALSNQFKKMTGLTPSFFKSIKGKRRQSLENI
jgi:AraC-like DNA-binding protein